MASLIISRRNFGLGLIAHGIAGCDRVENYAIPNMFAEKNVPAVGRILNLNGLRVHGYVEGDGSQHIRAHASHLNLKFYQL